MSKPGTLSKVIIGAGIGFGIGLLVAAKKGKVARDDVKNKFDELEEKIKNLELSDLKEGALEKLEELKVKINDLDEDKASELLSSKIKDIKNKLLELSRYIKRKSAPKLKSLINEISVRLDELDNE